MCGIAGEIGNRQFIDDNTSRSRLGLMLNKIKHRGPDDCRGWIHVNERYFVNIGSQRLAILDPEHGEQLTDSDGDVQIAFNGEIYNHRELRRNFGDFDDDYFKTGCDYEILCKWWQLWGDDCIRSLDGMFAFAVWDQKIETLFLVRDRMGKKPLYYFYDRSRNVLLFASEIKAILANPLYESFVKKSEQLNYDAIFDYICLQYCPEPWTAYRGIMAVPPGGVLRFSPASRKFEVDLYWNLEDEIAPMKINDGNMLELIRSSVRDAVHKRLESDVPMGVYLSGGLDSAIVTALAREKLDELHTFSVGFEEARFNELDYAEIVSKAFTTIHHTKMVESIDFYEMTKRVVDQYDQPFGDCSAIPTMLLNKFAKEHITVALTGDGGDEAYGGYDRYRLSRAADPKSYIPNLMVWSPAARGQILNPVMHANILDAGSTEKFLLSRVNPVRDVVANMLTIDTHTYLVNDIIVKMERAAMAYSIEARSPFLDPNVFAVAHSIPSSEKVGPLSGKNILKHAFVDMIPEAVILREKRGFSVPVSDWLRRPDGIKLLTETIWREAFGEFEVFDKNNVRDIANQHIAGQINVGHSLWCLVVLDLWLQKNFS